MSILLIVSFGFRIKKGDELIQGKGVESLLEDELHRVCRERGIHSGKEMRQQVLEQKL